MTKTTSSRIEKTPRVWTPEATWTISQDNREVATFLFPEFGPGPYHNVAAEVIANRKNRVVLPTGEQLAFLLDEAYNSPDEAIKQSSRAEFVRKNIMRDGWLLVPSVNVWTPRAVKNPGMYAVFDENGQGPTRIYSIEELEERLQGGENWRGVRFSQDGTVAFAPQNTITAGEHKKGTLAHDGAYIAVYRPNGAEALDRVAEQFKFNPYSWIVNNNSDEPIQTLSALGGYGVIVVSRLGADFDSVGNDRAGYVVSVSGSQNSAEGTAQKN